MRCNLPRNNLLLTLSTYEKYHICWRTIKIAMLNAYHSNCYAICLSRPVFSLLPLLVRHSSRNFRPNLSSTNTACVNELPLLVSIESPCIFLSLSPKFARVHRIEVATCNVSTYCVNYSYELQNKLSSFEINFQIRWSLYHADKDENNHFLSRCTRFGRTIHTNSRVAAFFI